MSEIAIGSGVGGAVKIETHIKEGAGIGGTESITPPKEESANKESSST